ncbi:MAG: CHASE2 domain-containing protein [Okeania sp. SIO1H6]|nr:CHASE2 domain-containing protein [Okeania sp. SIO1H6]
MGKVVVLKFNGNLKHNGFHLNSTVQVESDRSDHNYTLQTLSDIQGSLPADSLLAQQVEEWQNKYRNLGNDFFRGIKQVELEVQSNCFKRRKECKESAQQLKERFNSWLESPGFRQIDQQIRLKITSNEEVRFLIRTDDPKVHKLPWEEWDLIKENSSVEVVFGPTESKHNHSFCQSVLRGRLKILAILGDSKGINIEKDKQELKKLEEDRVAKVEFLEETNCEEISQKLNEQSWDVIFFAGHGETDENTGRIYLNSQGEYLELTDLWYSLRKAVERGLKIAIFNSCDGLGLARSLNDYHIPMMIVMRELLPDQVAHQFLINFLRAFQAGVPFHLAERQAREQLEKIEKEYYPCATWLPAIYQSIETPSFKWEPPCPIPYRFRCTIKIAILSSFASTILVLILKYFGLLSGLELSFYDQFMRMRPLEQPDKRLVIININKEDREWVKKNFPQEYDPARTIPDIIWKKLLKTVIQHKPAAIGVNIYHPEPTEDEELRSIFQNNAELITACHISGGEDDTPISYPPDILPLEISNRENHQTLSNNQKEIIQARSGFDNVIVDGNNSTVRRHLLIQSEGEKCLGISFSLAVTRRYFKNISHLYSKTPENYIVKFDLKLKGKSKGKLILNPPISNDYMSPRVFNSLNPENNGGYPLDYGYGGVQILLNYRSLKKIDDIAYLTFTLREILENPNFQESLFKDKIIIIANTERQLGKFFNTPYSKGTQKDTPTTILLAHQISEIISAVEDKRVLLTVWSDWLEYFWVAGWSLIGGLLLFGKLHYRPLIGIVAILVLSFSCYFLFLWGYWVPFIPALITLILAAVGGTVLLSSIIKARKT